MSKVHIVFKLTFNIPESKKKINLKDPILLIGSCFSDEIGEKLTQSKFKVLSNPFGTIYNPYSIFRLLKNEAEKNDLVESQGVYYHWDSHGVVSGLSKAEASALFENRVNETQAFFKQTKYLVITLGSAIVYEVDNQKIVANCHKVPQSQFSKRFLSRKEITEQFASLYVNLVPDLHIIFTISPVRHIRDGLVENNRSKSILINAVHEIVETYENVSYFPSFEIVMDELRDYRFFKPDMIHPSDEAIHYVWKRFIETYFDEESKTFLEEWGKLTAAIRHKPFQPKSNSHQQFIKSTLSKLEKLNQKVNVSVEIEQLKKQLL